MMLTAREAAALLGISVWAFYKLDISHYRYGPRLRRWERAEVEKHIIPEVEKHISPKRYKPNHPLRFKQFLTEEQIVATALPCFQGCAVYFLIENERIVYVGRASNVARRLAEHCRTEKRFTKIAFVECEAERVHELEQLYILKLQPRDNKHGVAGRGNRHDPDA